MKKRTVISSLILLLCLAACAPKTPDVVLLTDEARNRITNTLVVVVIDQKALDVKVYNKHTVSSPMFGGIIPALIDEGITGYRKSKALDLIEPLQAFADIQEIDAMFTESIGNAIRSTSRVPVKEVLFSEDFEHANVRELMLEYGVDSLLIVDVDYMVHANYRTMYGEARLKMLEKDGSKPLPKKKIYDTSSFLESASEEELIARWSANNGELLNMHLRELADGMANIIRISLLESGNE